MFASRVIAGRRVPSAAVYAVAVIVIFAYGAALRATKTRDFLATKIHDSPIFQDIDGWSVSHLLFFALLGVLFPGRPGEFLAVGIGWELFETALGQNRIEVSGKRLQLIGDADDEGRPTGDDDAFWYGKESDIVVDMIGYCLGSAAALRWWPNDVRRTPAAPAKKGAGESSRTEFTGRRGASRQGTSRQGTSHQGTSHQGAGRAHGRSSADRTETSGSPGSARL